MYAEVFFYFRKCIIQVFLLIHLYAIITFFIATFARILLLPSSSKYSLKISCRADVQQRSPFLWKQILFDGFFFFLLLSFVVSLWWGLWYKLASNLVCSHNWGWFWTPEPSASTSEVLRIQVNILFHWGLCVSGDRTYSLVHVRQALYQLKYNIFLVYS